LYWLAEAAWDKTAWTCSVLEMCHAAERVKQDPDKWHPMKRREVSKRRTRKKSMREIVAGMGTWEEFKEKWRAGR